VQGKFQNIINSKKPVLVDFYADWCGPCKQVPAILKQVKDELSESVRIIKVNVDKNPYIASKYQIRSIPTIMIFKDGMVRWTGVGVRNANEIKEVIQHISGKIPI
jgi:thioredoxin 1